MEIKEIEFNMDDVITSVLNVIAYIISPILFIWAVNTLFNCGIPMNFKSWLAGLVLIMLIKFHLRGTDVSCPYNEEYNDDEYDDEYNDEYDDDDDESIEKMKAKLIAYNEHKNKKNPPTDG